MCVRERTRTQPAATTFLPLLFSTAKTQKWMGGKMNMNNIEWSCLLVINNRNDCELSRLYRVCVCVHRHLFLSTNKCLMREFWRKQPKNSGKYNEMNMHANSLSRMSVHLPIPPPFKQSVVFHLRLYLYPRTLSSDKWWVLFFRFISLSLFDS